MSLIKLPLGQLLPGDEIFDRHYNRIDRIGMVERIEKNNDLRSVTVHLFGGGGWSQNWAAKVLVRRVHRGPQRPTRPVA